MKMAHIGFEMQNADVGVAPAPNDYTYSTIETSAAHKKMNPIGFEAAEGNAPVNSDGVTLLGFESIEGQDNNATETKVPLGHEGNSKVDDNLFFNNGVDRIDYILAYEPGTGEEETMKQNKRTYFEGQLEQVGLKLEHEDKMNE